MHTFDIQYRVTLSEKDVIDQKIEGICLEQSVELPMRVLTGEIREKIIGQCKSKTQLDDRIWEVIISYPYENIGGKIPNFLNILYGNISMQKGILVTGTEWNVLFEKGLFSGPAYGIDGIRNKLNIKNRALSSTALKPLGFDSNEIADLCYQFATGGVDVIKDDHGITDQSYSPFEERVFKCTEAIEKAAEKSGNRAFYFPNITATPDVVFNRYKKAAEIGADGVLICPHISGLETMHRISLSSIELPVIAHPSFSGGLTTHGTQGLTPQFLYGQLWRALGADFVIYPNKDTRFHFSLEQCQAINNSARDLKLPFRKSFPMPGGGIKLDQILSWIETYGPDTVFLVGSSLYDYDGGIQKAAKKFRNILMKGLN